MSLFLTDFIKYLVSIDYSLIMVMNILYMYNSKLPLEVSFNSQNYTYRIVTYNSQNYAGTFISVLSWIPLI